MIKNIILDCDGCLTDGRKWVDKHGRRQLIAFNSRDDIAMRRLLEMGYRVIIVTASEFEGIWTYWGTRGRTERNRVEVYHSTDKGNLDAEIRATGGLGFNWEETLGVGDCMLDLPFLEKCAAAYVPADAHRSLRFERLRSRGGEGVVVDVLIKLTA